MESGSRNTTSCMMLRVTGFTGMVRRFWVDCYAGVRVVHVGKCGIVVFIKNTDVSAVPAGSVAANFTGHFPVSFDHLGGESCAGSGHVQMGISFVGTGLDPFSALHWFRVRTLDLVSVFSQCFSM
jgi:hypothetical protein